MNPLLVKYITYPLHERLSGRDTPSYLKELEQAQWYSPSDLRKYQLEKLKALLRHSYENVPYYRELFKNLRISPADIRNFEDLPILPFLTKKIIRNNLEQLKASNFTRRLLPYSTSGSTGEPLQFYIDNIRAGYSQALYCRFRRWWGIDIGSRGIKLWGAPLKKTKLDILRSICDYSINIKFISAFEMDYKSMGEYAKNIRNYKPEYIYAYPSSLYLFSRFLEKNKINLQDIGIKAIFVTAEMLYDFQREAIEQTFGCPVANQYAARDGGVIAHQCPSGGMHMAENVYVEFVNNDKLVENGEKGEVAITHLDLYGMPLIRYKMGDMASALNTACNCRRGSGLLKNIEGRSADFIVRENGRVIHALSLMYILREEEGVNQFKVIQKDINYFEVYLVKNNWFSRMTEINIHKKFRDLLGENITVEFLFKESIREDNTGKYRYVVSDCIERYMAGVVNQ